MFLIEELVKNNGEIVTFGSSGEHSGLHPYERMILSAMRKLRYSPDNNESHRKPSWKSLNAFRLDSVFAIESHAIDSRSPVMIHPSSPCSVLRSFRSPKSLEKESRRKNSCLIYQSGR